jgi:hypothetical protein
LDKPPSTLDGFRGGSLPSIGSPVTRMRIQSCERDSYAGERFGFAIAEEISGDETAG